MKQIRVAWRTGAHAAREVGLTPCDGEPWVPDTPQNRDDILAMVASGNAVCGADTHWLEEMDSGGN
jgi:hypothetical protein